MIMTVIQRIIYGSAVFLIYLALFIAEYVPLNFFIEMFTFNFFIKLGSYLLFIIVVNPIITYLIADRIPFRVHDLKPTDLDQIRPDEEDTLK